LSNSTPGLAHHFNDLAQQKQAATLGIWFFLVTEIMFFGGMFTGYAVYRSSNPAAFDSASHHLDIRLGAFNTAVLIASNLTMVLGTVFLGVKAVEYTHKHHEHLIPGPGFVYEAADANGAEIFFSFYFAMTGMHALHMVVGIGIMLVLVAMAYQGRFSSSYNNPVEVSGLYWHFVDIVWIFLFPLLYLLGRS